MLIRHDPSTFIRHGPLHALFGRIEIADAQKTLAHDKQRSGWPPSWPAAPTHTRLVGLERSFRYEQPGVAGTAARRRNP